MPSGALFYLVNSKRSPEDEPAYAIKKNYLA